MEQNKKTVNQRKDVKTWKLDDIHAEFNKELEIVKDGSLEKYKKFLVMPSEELIPKLMKIRSKTVPKTPMVVGTSKVVKSTLIRSSKEKPKVVTVDKKLFVEQEETNQDDEHIVYR